MSCNRVNCACVALVVAILAGVVLGVLYSLGFVATGILFWAYLALGGLSILLSPLYAAEGTRGAGCRCACRYRRWLLGAAVGTVLSAGIGLLVATVAGVIVISIFVGIATFFAAFLLGIVICLTNCLCDTER